MGESDGKAVKKEGDEGGVGDGEMGLRLDVFGSFMIFVMMG